MTNSPFLIVWQIILHNPDFEIIAESPDWIVVNKPAHLLVYPSKPGGPTTLLDELEQLLVFEIANGAQLSIMNRLDRETSGLVLVAKHKKAASQLGKAAVAKQFTKIYRAIVHGWPEQDHWQVDAPIIRKGEVTPSEIYVRQMVHPKGKPALTKFTVLNRFESQGHRYAELKCQLVSGRTHQIRVHLEHHNLPIVGDKIYGHSGAFYLKFVAEGWSTVLMDNLLMDRHALHASELIWQNEHWISPLPKILDDFLKK